jgi:cysteinyl-tRNA synthetase
MALDPREEMRRFVQSIRTFARQHRRGFVIIPQNGLDLLIKSDEADEGKPSPARTYMRSIDGVLQEGLFFGIPEFGQPTDSDRRETLLSLTDMARTNGLSVFVVDYGTAAATIAESRRLNNARKLLSIVAPARGLEVNRLPTYIKRPEGENPKSIITMKDVRNFVYLRDSSTFGRQDQFALTLHENNIDMVVTDVFHRTGEPLSKQTVETLKYKKIGARRLVLAYVNIGTAASYHYYWRPHWTEGSPLWINAPYPGDPDRYYVQ